MKARTLRADVEAAHLRSPGAEPRPLEGIGVRPRRQDLRGLHCQRGSRDLFAEGLARPYPERYC